MKFPTPMGPTHLKKYSERAHPPPPRRNTIGIFLKHSLKKGTRHHKDTIPVQTRVYILQRCSIYTQNRLTYQMHSLAWDLSLL